MNFKSLYNKYHKPLSFVVTILSIATSILGYLDLIPGFMASCVLVLGAFLILPSIHKLNGISITRRWIISSTVIIIFAGLGYHFMVSDSKKHGESILYSHSATSSNTSVITNNTAIESSSNDNVRDINKKENKIEINAPITTNDNSNLTIANEIHYNNPPQRHLNNEDLKIIKSIGGANNKIRILYPPNNNEALVFAEEIFTKIFDLGYKHVSKGTTDNSLKPSTKKFSITYGKEPENIINIIINTQI